MIDLRIRDGRAADAPDIVAMIEALSLYHGDVAGIGLEDVIFLCFGPSPWLRLIVAEHDRRIVGYAALQKKVQLQFARRLMDLQHLFVIPQMREQGVGRALIAHAAEHARLHRCAGLTLGVMAQNTPAQAFYRALGFQVRETGGAIQMVCRLPLRSGQVAP